MLPTIALILGSAATGALVSSAFNAVSGFFERRGRRNDLLLSKAVELAELHISRAADIQKTSGKGVVLAPYIVQVRWFHKELKHLYLEERLTPAMEKSWSQYIEDGKLPSNTREL